MGGFDELVGVEAGGLLERFAVPGRLLRGGVCALGGAPAAGLTELIPCFLSPES